MKCAEFEIRVCDYQDGTLEAAARREVEEHATACVGCAELLAGGRELSGFLARVPAVETPPELVTNILYRTQPGSAAWKAATMGWRLWFQPLLGPKFAMSMAMTILSVSMLYRVAGVEVRQLEAADLNPVKIWRAIDARAQGVWSKGVKVYQNVRFLWELQSQIGSLEAEEEAAGEEAKPGGRETNQP